MSIALRPPSYRLHKARNCAVVTIHGKNQYLGPFGSPESHEKYARLLTQWHAQDGQPASAAETTSSHEIVTVNAVIMGYLDFAKAEYVKHGRPTGELNNIRGVLKVLKELYGRTPAGNFSAKRLKLVCKAMLLKGWRRDNTNRQISRVKRMFRWASITRRRKGSRRKS